MGWLEEKVGFAFFRRSLSLKAFRWSANGCGKVRERFQNKAHTAAKTAGHSSGVLQRLENRLMESQEE